MYKTITETFPEELIEMLEEEDFEFISEEMFTSWPFQSLFRYCR